MNNDRFTDIETRLAYQEKMIRELNDVIIEQQQEIDTLHRICQKLETQNRALAEMAGGGIGPADEKPPHY